MNISKIDILLTQIFRVVLTITIFIFLYESVELNAIILIIITISIIISSTILGFPIYVILIALIGNKFIKAILDFSIIVVAAIACYLTILVTTLLQ